jgi:enoyl-CoA hydratase/carnithine racemase
MHRNIVRQSSLHGAAKKSRETFQMKVIFAEGGLTLEVESGIAVVTLNNPGKRNALNQAMWLALPAIFDVIEKDRDILATIVTGTGEHFAAGADISEFESVFGSPEAATQSYQALAKGLEAISRSSKPVLAAIEGFCVGGGVAIALACDIRFAGATARFAITPAKLGFVYPLCATRRLVRTVGASKASRLLFTGRLFDAPAALAMTIIDETVPAGGAFAAAWQEACEITAVSQFSVRAAKAVIQGFTGIRPLPQAEVLLLDTVQGVDFREGSTAFVAKRAPRFTYR